MTKILLALLVTVSFSLCSSELEHDLKMVREQQASLDKEQNECVEKCVEKGGESDACKYEECGVTKFHSYEISGSDFGYMQK